MATGLLESIDLSTQLSGYNRLALLLFRLGERQIFGINVFKVQEVMLCPTLTRLPGSHHLISGVADIRGAVIPVIDLPAALGGIADPTAPHLIVAEFSRSVQGFLVREVDRIIHVNVEAVQPPPRRTGEEGYLTAITRYGDEIVQILDVERLLANVIGQPQEMSSALAAQAEGIGSGRRVLIADDSRVARSQVERVLEQLGIETVSVNDGREALSYLQRIADSGTPITEHLLMVISDIEMPDMDGYMLTAEIRRDPRLRELYVLLHTSLSGAFNHSLVQKVGADKFLSKFSSDELAAEILARVKAAQDR